MRIRILGLLFIFAISGCAQIAVTEEPNQARSPELLIASDLVNTLMQVDGYHPQTTRLQMQSPEHGFGETLNNVLLSAGYDIQHVSVQAGDRFVSYLLPNRQSGPDGTPLTYQLNVGGVKIKRDYSLSLDRVQPASAVYMLGADASTIRLNDQIFSIDDKSEPSLVPSGQIAERRPTTTYPVSDPFQHVSTEPAVALVPTATPSADESIELLVNGESNPGTYSPGDNLNFTVRTTVDVRLSCYYQDPGEGIMRVYPNRFTAESVVAAGSVVHIPSSEHWAIEATRVDSADRLMCVSLDPEFDSRLSHYEATPDLETLPVQSFEQLLEEIEIATGIEPQAQEVSVPVK